MEAYVDLSRHGYVLLDVTPRRVQGDWYFANTIAQPILGEVQGESWYVEAGERFLRQASAPATAPAGYNPPSVPRPRQITGLRQTSPVLVGVYPNPAQDYVTLQLYTPQAQSVEISLWSPDGRQIATYMLRMPTAGTHYYQIPLENVPVGAFLLRIQGEACQTYRLLKR